MMKVKTSPYHPVRRIRTPVENGIYGRDANPELLMFDKIVRSPHITEYRKLKKVKTPSKAVKRIRTVKTPLALLKDPKKRELIKNACIKAKAMRKTTDHKNDPSHYTECTIEPIEFVLANNLGPCEANVVKYVTRWKQKDGINDLRKAIRYLELLIEHEDYKGKAKKAGNG